MTSGFPDYIDDHNFIYFISWSNMIRVGQSFDIKTRLITYARQLKNPKPVLIGLIEGGLQDEWLLHTHVFPLYRIAEKGKREWYHDRNEIRKFAGDLMTDEHRALVNQLNQYLGWDVDQLFRRESKNAPTERP